MLVKVTEVTGIVKGINLPVAIREPLVRTGDPIQQHRKVGRLNVTGLCLLIARPLHILSGRFLPAS
jgi:hypothetical protein